MVKKLRLKESFGEGYKMYLQEDNGGWGLLYTDGEGNWFYMNEYDIPIDFGNNAKENVRRVENAIRNNELYDAEGMVENYGDYDHIIKAYSEMTLDDIDDYENYETTSFGDRVPMGHGTTTWYVINAVNQW